MRLVQGLVQASWWEGLMPTHWWVELGLVSLVGRVVSRVVFIGGIHKIPCSHATIKVWAASGVLV